MQYMPLLRPCLIGAAVLGVAACAGGAPPSGPADPQLVAALDAHQPNPCNGALASALAGVRPADVQKVVYVSLRGDTGGLTGYNVWVTLANQPGEVVANISSPCNVFNVYGRDGGSPPRRTGG